MPQSNGLGGTMVKRSRKTKGKVKQSKKSISCCNGVVFLDVDGVLVSFGNDADVASNDSSTRALNHKNPSLQALATIFIAHPKSRLVISSTWRCCANGMNDLAAAFCAFGPPLSTLSLLETTSLAHHTHRRLEIAAWLFEHEETRDSPFVVIDDDAPEILSKLIPDHLQVVMSSINQRVVAPLSHVGLTSTNAEQATKLLQTPRMTEKR
eukprot:m.211444 g.211444  ORF g.211444 m.211444 type:complete len:209 (-) comp33104_c4_seq39:49-675(-)